MLQKEIHIGNIIKAKLKEEGRSMSWLAKKIHYERANISRLLKRPCINTNLLLRIAKTMSHDFFAYYSETLLEK